MEKIIRYGSFSPIHHPCKFPVWVPRGIGQQHTFPSMILPKHLSFHHCNIKNDHGSRNAQGRHSPIFSDQQLENIQGMSDKRQDEFRRFRHLST